MFKQTPIDEALAPIAKLLCEDRDDAVKERKKKGLDSIWQKAREQYAGIDEATRGRMSPIDGKAQTLDGPVSIYSNVGKVHDEPRSTVFVNITRPYTNAGTARVADLLLPTGKMPWDLQLSPVSDLQILKDILQGYPNQLALLAQLDPEAGMLLNQTEEDAKAAMEIAKQQITDWIKESDWLGQIRKQILEAGKVGTGVLKGPFPKRREVAKHIQSLLGNIPLAFIDNLDLAAQITEKLDNGLRYTPATECIKVENCYPAPGCGEDFQNGKYFIERVPDVSRRRLSELQDDPSYFPEQIAACLEEGPKDEAGNKKDKNTGYDLWIRTGIVDLNTVLDDLDTDEPPTDEFLTVILCNKRIIKMAKPMLNSKEFPYRMLRWEPREDSWDGVGIPEHIETPQRGLNAGVRALMDNMGYSVGPQVVEVEDLIEPISGDDTQLRPYKRWRVKPGLPGMSNQTSPKDAIFFLEFPNYLNEIMPVINWWLKMAEDTTGLPLLLQGQASTDAVGVSQQLMNNNTTNMRQIVKTWDDEVCKPNIDDHYAWCQLYGAEAAKGDAEAVSLGSSVLLVKELQMQALMQIGDRVLQPVYGKSPSKWMDLFLEGNQIDPNLMTLDEEERQRLEAAESQPDPKVVAAQIEAQGNVMVAQIKDATAQLKIFVDAQTKGASILQAKDAVETQAAANITQEGIKQEGQAAKLAAAPTPEAAPEPELDIDTALQKLGYQG